MNGEKNNLLLGKLCGKIAKGFDLNAGETFTCSSNIVRVAAIEESYIKSSVFNEDNIGIYIPGGIVEYFEVSFGDIITCISGSVNVSSSF